MLTKRELERYDRQIMLDGFGERGQEELKKAKVVIAGNGGLGSPIALYLTAAGIGHIRIIDRGKVELSNLHRQVLHWEEDLRCEKVQSSIRKLIHMNSHVTLEPISESISEDNVAELVRGFDVIVDALDRLPARLLLNKAAVEMGIPFIHGACGGFGGRVMTIIPGKTACLRCLYHMSVPKVKMSVLGTIPAVIGCIQATEVIKYLTGIGSLLTDRILLYNGLGMTFTEVPIRKDPKCPHCGH